MLIGKFIEPVRKNDCEVVPMPEWNNARTVKVIHKKNGRSAYLNTYYEDLWEAPIEAVCIKLGVTLPTNYDL